MTRTPTRNCSFGIVAAPFTILTLLAAAALKLGQLQVQTSGGDNHGHLR